MEAIPILEQALIVLHIVRAPLERMHQPRFAVRRVNPCQCSSHEFESSMETGKHGCNESKAIHVVGTFSSIHSCRLPVSYWPHVGYLKHAPIWPPDSPVKS